MFLVTSGDPQQQQHATFTGQWGVIFETIKVLFTNFLRSLTSKSEGKCCHRDNTCYILILIQILNIATLGIGGSLQLDDGYTSVFACNKHASNVY